MTKRYNKPTIKKIQVKAIYPDGMTRQQYIAELKRVQARHIAELLLRQFPELVRPAIYQEAA